MPVEVAGAQPELNPCFGMMDRAEVNLDPPFTGSGCLSFERQQDSEACRTSYFSTSAFAAVRPAKDEGSLPARCGPSGCRQLRPILAHCDLARVVRNVLPRPLA